MKRLTYIFLAIVLFTAACKKGDIDPSIPLVGKWKAAEYYYSIGGPGVWTAVPEHKYLRFFSNGILQTDYYSDCSNYVIKDSVKVTLYNDQKTKPQEFAYLIKKDTLIMNPSAPFICIEGCATKFVREK